MNLPLLHLQATHNNRSCHLHPRLYTFITGSLPAAILQKSPKKPLPKITTSGIPHQGNARTRPPTSLHLNRRLRRRSPALRRTRTAEGAAADHGMNRIVLQTLMIPSDEAPGTAAEVVIPVPNFHIPVNWQAAMAHLHERTTTLQNRNHHNVRIDLIDLLVALAQCVCSRLRFLRAAIESIRHFRRLFDSAVLRFH